MHTLDLIRSKFISRFQIQPELLVRAPGRINLIGEHTDYNGGFVLPASVDKAIYFCLSSRTDDQILLYSADLEEELTLNTSDLKKTDKGWANFLIGVMAELEKDGARFTHGFQLCFGGDVPLGAGMSSSAAIESGMGTAMNSMFSLGKTQLELALIAQRAEHNFAGVRCGIMDMYASIFGRKNQLIRLDCRDLTHEYLPFDFPEVAIVLFNTGVKHNLAETAYNERREECEAGVKRLNEVFHTIRNLRDATLEQLEQIRESLPEKVYKRCHFVLSETRRMMEATRALQNEDLRTFGKLMYETHEGLSKEYEVSCKELDFLVEQVSDQKEVIGARMMGGGFGGCTINLVEKPGLGELVKRVKQAYERQFGIEPEHYVVSLTDGCSVISEG